MVNRLPHGESAEAMGDEELGDRSIATGSPFSAPTIACT